MKLRYYLTIIFILILFQAMDANSAYKPSSIIKPVSISDSEKIFPMNQMIITATRTEKELFLIPREVVVVKKQELEERNIRFTPDALAESPSILVQKTNYGGGAPVIRGLIGNQVLILVDGIRLNNSTFRFGPNQYLNTVSPSLIDRVEVVEGPGSVLYGSDALGGTINLITRDSKSFSLSGLRSSTIAATADKSVIQHFDYNTRAGNLNFLIGGGYQKFNDLSTGNGYLHPTGYSGYDANARVDYTINDKQNLTFAYQMSELKDVPRTDRIVNKNDKLYLFTPQRQELGYLSYQGNPGLGFINTIKATASFNQQTEGRESIPLKTDTLTNDYDRVKTFGATVEMHTVLSEDMLLTYGLEYYHDDISSNRDTTDLGTGKTGSTKSQFPNGTTYDTFAAFIQDQYDLGALYINAGARYSSFKFKGTLSAPYGETVSTPNDVTFSLNLGYKLFNEQLNVVGGVAQGFRAPNVDDIAVFGKSGSGSGARFEVPSPGLKPEHSLNYEFGLKFRNETVGASLFYYFSDYTDLITPKLGSYNGQDSISGTPVYQRYNVGKAEIQGVNLTSHYQLSSSWRVRAEASWTEGNNTTDNEPLTRIPPKRGVLGVTYSQDKYWVEYYNMFASYQNRVSAADKKDARIGPDGTPGYLTYNLRGGYKFSDHINTIVTFENIFNRFYKLHGSGIYSPGSNVILSLLLNL